MSVVFRERSHREPRYVVECHRPIWQTGALGTTLALSPMIVIAV